MMIRLFAAAAVAASVCTAVAAPSAPKVLTLEEMAAADGGLVVKPGTPKGKIAVVDTQSRFPAESVKSVLAGLAKGNGYNFVYERAEPVDCACKLKDRGDLVLVIADDPKQPTSLVSPDDHWAMMNVARLDVGLKTDAARAKFFEGRCRRQLARVFAIAAGGWASQFGGNLMSADKLQNIDLAGEGLPIDVKARCDRYLPTFGVTKKVVETYYVACRNGWAPAPTNDVQREIWNDFHSELERGPKNALKIVPPKK